MSRVEDEMESAEEKRGEEASLEEVVGEDDAGEVINGDDKREGDAGEVIDGDDKGEDDAGEVIDGDDKGEDDAGNEEEQIDGDDKEEVDGDRSGNEGSDDIEKKGAIPLAEDDSEENTKSPDRPREMKSSEGLNLNNEVVRMRKEVKRVRVLIIRKLTRHLAALKKKKGNEAEMERNQRRAARLLEEIHALRALAPDVVTKTALQKNLNFDEECKNPKATISDRALARVATHPQFHGKIQDIKAAVRAFKEERLRGGVPPRREKVQKKGGKAAAQPPDGEREEESEKVGGSSVVKKKVVEKKGGEGVFKGTAGAKLPETGKETEKATDSADVVGEKREMPESKNVKPAVCSKGRSIVQNKPQNPHFKPEELQEKKDEDDSDLESSGDEGREKEYFDDSTEERFHKQSSQSEQSDDDDFFVGKVSKFKKKKKKESTEGEKSRGGKTDPAGEVQGKLDEAEARMRSKSTSLQSVFCSLSASRPGPGRGRGGDGFRGRGKPRGGGSGPRGDFNKQSNYPKQGKGTETNSFSKFNKSDSRGFLSGGRGRGRGRGDAPRQSDRPGGGVFSRQAPTQALHPSWEASKKRKEQQGQIHAFQGKKIKFDDDD